MPAFFSGRKSAHRLSRASKIPGKIPPTRHHRRQHRRKQETQEATRMNPKTGNRRPFMAVVVLVVLILAVILTGCSGKSDVDTGRTFDPSSFSVSDARDTLAVAVRDVCFDSNVGVSRLASPLRRVETVSATQQSQDWIFRSYGKSVTMSPTGKVSGYLLKDLTSGC